LNKLYSNLIAILYDNFEQSYLQKTILTFGDLDLGSVSLKTL